MLFLVPSLLSKSFTTLHKACKMGTKLEYFLQEAWYNAGLQISLGNCTMENSWGVAPAPAISVPEMSHEATTREKLPAILPYPLSTMQATLIPASYHPVLCKSLKS